MSNATATATTEPALTDADFDADNMFPTPKTEAPSRDAQIADDDNARSLRSKRPSRSKVQ